MGALSDLGLTTSDGPIMVVAAPDSVLAEAGAMKPRPSFASTLVTAKPTARLVWWPERRHLEAQTLGRLRWLLEVSGGGAWLVVDESEEESPSEDELRHALLSADLSQGETRTLGRGELAIPVSAGS